MKKIYLNRMEKKTWNHININEKVMTVPYIEFKENEEIIGSINDRIRKIPNPGNYTRKDQEHENNSIKISIKVLNVLLKLGKTFFKMLLIQFLI